MFSFISMLIVFYNHHYYDDEIYNLSKMYWSFNEIFTHIQGSDVHPPLSYLINKLLFDIFSSYKAILIFSIIINAASLGYFYKFSEKKLDDKYTKSLLFMFVFLNGGLLLWTNSVRWYAYWVPLFVVLYTYLLRHQKLTDRNVIIISFLLSMMTYINYLTFPLLLALALYFIFLRRNDINIKNVFLFCLVYFSLSLYQIFIFLTVHIQNKDGQVSNILNSALNAIYGILNGGSVFIADPIFLIFSIATLLIIIIGFKNMLIEKKAISPLLLQSIVLLLTLISLMIFTGLSGKYRNNIALSIPFYFTLSCLFFYIKNASIKRGYIVIVLLLSVVSVFNLVTHTNTSKNSYNMPITKLHKILKNPKGKLIFTYDASTLFYFSTSGYDVVYLLKDQEEMNISKGTDIYLVQTYQGSLSDQKYMRVLSLYEIISDGMDIIKTSKIGVDKYSNIKNMLPGGRPKINQVQMYIFQGRLKKSLLILPWKNNLETK